jgi:hypothetical protein
MRNWRLFGAKYGQIADDLIPFMDFIEKQLGFFGRACVAHPG